MACHRLRGTLSLLLAFFLCLMAGAWAVPSPFRVLTYDTRVEIETSGDIVVTEHITISIPTDGTNKGIIRDIPVNPRWHDKGRQGVKLDVLDVRIDGKSCRTDDTEMTYPVLSIYMRDRASYLHAGQHRFTLRYRMSEQVGFFEEGDELTWNAVGEHWKGGVQQARATIVSPPGTHFTDYRAWLGERGSHDTPVTTRRTVVDGREACVFEAERPMREDEAFTVAVSWPTGIIAAPETVLPEDQWGYTLFYAIGLAASLFGAWKLWATYGRDPQAAPIIPLFYPPKVPQRLRANADETANNEKSHGSKGNKNRLQHGEEYMTPVAVHYVNEGGELEGHGIAALLLSLAQRGDCSLRGTAKKGIVVEKHSATSPAPEEKAAALKLPQELPLNARKSTHSPIGKVYDACKLRLDMDYPMLVEWNIGGQITLWLGLILVLGFAALNQLGDNPSELIYQALSGCGMSLALMLGGLAGIAFQIRNMRKERRFSLNFLPVLLFCGMFIFVGFIGLSDVDIFWIYSPLQLGLMLAALLPPIVFGFLMDMPSREQVELKQQIKGLALYIGTAESERFNTFNPPEEDLQLYHRLLPYAVALGLEDAWGKRFAEQLADALRRNEELYTADITVDLVRSSRISLGTYREAVFAEQAAKYASTSGGGSSFGGFGGGAGSGGGGGGGRAC